MSCASRRALRMSDLELLLGEMEAHDRVGDALVEHPERIFLSGWNGSHPFVSEMVGDVLVRLGERTSLLTEYSHLDEDPELSAALSQLHQSYGEPAIAPERFAPGAGSSAFLATLLHHVTRLGFNEIHYLPPVYYNAIYWIRELRFRVSRVADRAPLDGQNPHLRLPNRRSCLWITDPLWFAGTPLSPEIIAEIGAWQSRTDSVVMVDGTFAYMEWDGPVAAPTAALDPNLTYRLVCPTKTLALHGFRFAYAITPDAAATEFREFHGRMHGATSLADRLFAHRAVSLLNDKTPAKTLWPYVRQRLDGLLAAGAFDDVLMPTGGYFVFGKPAVSSAHTVGLSSECFSTSLASEYVRVNLLDDEVVDYLLGVRRGVT
jgi:aspartate/methionine/tyrosine aminotransferase